MPIRPEEITSILAKELEGLTSDAQTEHVGTVLQVGDGIARVHGLANAMASELIEFYPAGSARVHGLPDCQMGELLEFPGGVMGLALNLEEDSIGAVLMGSDEHIKEGDPVRETGRIISVPVGKGLLGRVVNPLGQPLDGKGPIPSEETRLVEV
ncbi:MAG: hypothetical protein C4340_05405, partial [Armatimonadota bacterium]